MIETKFNYSKPKVLLNEENFEKVTMDQPFEEYSLDNINKKILEELSKNSRESLVEISQKLSLTPNAIKERIKKLKRDNIILSHRVEINYHKLGFSHYRIFLHLENFSNHEENKLTHFLNSLSEITSVTKTIGYCSLEIRGYFENVENVYKVMNIIRKEFPKKIKEHETIIYRKFHSTLNYFPFE